MKKRTRKLFIIVLLLSIFFEGSVFAKVFWTDNFNGTVQNVNTGGTGLVNVVGGIVMPIGIVLDEIGNKVYWTDEGAGVIQKSNLDGSNVEILYSGLISPRGIGLDVPNNLIFWADNDSGSGVIKIGSLDGLVPSSNLFTGLKFPRSIEVDQINGKIYWSDGFVPHGPGKIMVGNTNGLGSPVILYMASVPKGVTIDVFNNYIYWVEDSTGTINRGSLDGIDNPVVIWTFLFQAPLGLSINVAQNKLFWTIPGSNGQPDGEIQSGNLDGSGVTETIVAGLGFPWGIDVMENFEVEDIIAGHDMGISYIKIFDENGSELNGFQAFGAKNSSGSIRMAKGDVTGDGENEIIVGHEKGDSTVRVFTKSGDLLQSFRAFGAGNSSGSVRLVVGDINGDGVKEIIVGQELGNSYIRIFDVDGVLLKTFKAFGPYNTSGSVRLAVGDIDGDNIDEIIVGHENGTSAVKIFQGDGTLLSTFNAFGLGNSSGSVRVATGDVDGDGVDEIVVGQEGANSVIRIFEGDGDLIQSFKSFGSMNGTGSARIAIGDVDGDGKYEIIAGHESGTSVVRVFNEYGVMLKSFAAFGAGNSSGSVRVVTADVNGDGLDEILVGQELGMSFIRIFNGEGQLQKSFKAFGSFNTSGSIRLTTGMEY